MNIIKSVNIVYKITKAKTAKRYGGSFKKWHIFQYNNVFKRLPSCKSVNPFVLRYH